MVSMCVMGGGMNRSKMLGNKEGDDQNLEGIYAPIYLLVFVLLPATKVDSCPANAGRSIKEAGSVVPWMKSAGYGYSMMC